MTLQPDEPGDDALDPAFADYLLGVLVRTLPAAEDEAADLARRNAIRLAFQSMRPRNAMEAMLAVEAITVHHVIMGCFRTALRPETDPAEAARARSSAATLSRVRLTTLRLLEKQQAPAPATVQAARPVRKKADAVQPVEAPAPMEPPPEQPPLEGPRYLPRDRFGEPIPVWRWSDMTMAQRRAAFADPAQVAAREEALAEEAAMIGAREAAEASPPAPDAGATPRPSAPC
jgi:hypothetical protein